tara:strand:- start:147 stop:530 length:384 start_codon:yes stop_codon:yes gene_type:complete
MKTKGIILVSVLIIAAYFSYKYVYQEHRNILTEKANFSLSSKDLFAKFNNSPKAAGLLYINKTIDVQGRIHSIESDIVVVEPSIVCKLDTTFSSTHLNIGDSLFLKGRCIGFDDLFMEVKMDNVSFY